MNELKTWNFNDTDEMDKDIWENTQRLEEQAWNHTEFYKDVVESISNRKGLIDGLEGRKSVEIINAI